MFSSVFLYLVVLKLERMTEEILFYPSRDTDWKKFFTLHLNFLGRLSGDQKFGRDKCSLFSVLNV